VDWAVGGLYSIAAVMLTVDVLITRALFSHAATQTGLLKLSRDVSVGLCALLAAHTAYMLGATLLLPLATLAFVVRLCMNSAHRSSKLRVFLVPRSRTPPLSMRL
jgi:hypothetical protein